MLAVPVPALGAFVRARTAHYDPAYLAEDPRFGQAHVTVLGPWLRSPVPEDLAVIGALAAGTACFDYGLAQLGTFPNGVIHLLPDPLGPFTALTAAVVERFPDHPPYGGMFPDPVPHVTLDAVGPGVDEAAVALMLGDLVPVTCRAESIQLQWWQAGACRVLQEWPLGGTGGAA